MATVNERLAALEAAVSSLTGLTGGVSTTVLSDTTATQEAQQNQRLTAVEAKASAATANLVTETTQRQAADAELQTSLEALFSQAAGHAVRLDLLEATDATTAITLADHESRITDLEGYPQPAVVVRTLASSLGSIASTDIGAVTGEAVAATYVEEVEADSPVAWWRLGEASGNPQDSAGTNHSTATATLTYGATGAVAGDTAITFPTSGYLTVPDHASLDLGDTFSIEFWMKRTTLGTWQMVIDKGVTGGTAFLVYLRTTNELWLSDTSSLAETASVDSTAAAALLDTSSFHHYVVTKSGATRQWYVDGVAVTTGGSNQTFGNSTNSLTIGYSPSHTSDKLSATLDEVALYSTALSAARVLAHYEAVTGGGGGGGGGGSILTIGPSTTQAQFETACRNLSLDVIEFTAGTYTGWNQVEITADRSSRPLIIRAAAGATVIFRGPQPAADPDVPFHVGYQSFAEIGTWTRNISILGPFILENYRIIYSGFMTHAVKDITINNITIRNCWGETVLANPQNNHSLYINTDGVHRSSNITANNWTVGPWLNGRTVTGLQTDHAYNCDGVTAIGWNVTGSHRAAYLWGDATGILIDGWTISNCLAGFDSSGGSATGTVQNCTGTGTVYGYPYYWGTGITYGSGNSGI